MQKKTNKAFKQEKKDLRLLWRPSSQPQHLIHLYGAAGLRQFKVWLSCAERMMGKQLGFGEFRDLEDSFRRDKIGCPQTDKKR